MENYTDGLYRAGWVFAGTSSRTSSGWSSIWNIGTGVLAAAVRGDTVTDFAVKFNHGEITRSRAITDLVEKVVTAFISAGRE